MAADLLGGAQLPHVPSFNLSPAAAAALRNFMLDLAFDVCHPCLAVCWQILVVCVRGLKPRQYTYTAAVCWLGAGCRLGTGASSLQLLGGSLCWTWLHDACVTPV